MSGEIIKIVIKTINRICCAHLHLLGRNNQIAAKGKSKIMTHKAIAVDPDRKRGKKK